MNDNIKNTLRSLVSCSHPLEAMCQVAGFDHVMQWCSVCGACRILANGTLNEWRSCNCAVKVKNILIEQALEIKED